MRHHLPLAPLLHAYTRNGLPTVADLGRLPDLGPRFSAILGASARFLDGDYLDRASDKDLAEALSRFYEACVDPPLHGEVVRRRVGFLRHGLAYLLRAHVRRGEEGGQVGIPRPQYASLMPGSDA